MIAACPVAYDHDDDPCAVCGWSPNAGPETRMDPDAWARIERTAAALNARIANGCCPGQHVTEEPSRG